MRKACTRRGAKAARLECSFGSGVRVRTDAQAGPSNIMGAARAAVAAPTTKKRRVAERAAALLLLALLSLSEADSGSNSSSTATNALISALENLKVDWGLIRQDSAMGVHHIPSTAPRVLLAAAQKARNVGKGRYRPGTFVEGKHDSFLEKEGGLQGRLRGSGGRGEAEQQEPQTVLRPRLPIAGETKQGRTLAAAVQREDVVVSDNSGIRRHAGRPGAALGALHNMLDRVSTHGRHLADAELTAAADAAEAAASRQGSQAAATEAGNIPNTGMSKRMLKKRDRYDWWETYFPSILELQPAPVSHVYDYGEHDDTVAAIFDLPSHEDCSVNLDSLDRSETSHDSLDIDVSVTEHKNNKTSRNARASLDQMDDLQETSEYHAPVRPEHRSGTSRRHEHTARRDKQADTDYYLGVEAAYPALPHQEPASDLERSGAAEVRTALIMRDPRVTDADLTASSAGPSVSGVSETFTPTTAAEAAALPSASIPASLPKLGHYSEVEPALASARRYDTVASWALQGALGYLDRERASKRPRPSIVGPSLSTLPGDPEDSAFNTEMYSPPSLSYDAPITASVQPHSREEQLQHLFTVQAPSVSHEELAQHLNSRDTEAEEGQQYMSRYQRQTNGDTQQRASRNAIQVAASRLVYHTWDSPVMTTQSGDGSGSSTEDSVEKSSATRGGVEHLSNGKSNYHHKEDDTASNSERKNSPPTNSILGSEDGKDKVSKSEKGVIDEGQKGNGNFQRGVGSGPMWRLPPVMGHPFFMQPSLPLLARFPKLPDEATETPDGFPVVHPPSHPLPFMSQSKDERIQPSSYILCQLSGYDQGCVQPRASEKRDAELLVMRDSNEEEMEEDSVVISTDDNRTTDLPTGDPIPAPAKDDTNSPGVGSQTPPETTPTRVRGMANAPDKPASSQDEPPPRTALVSLHPDLIPPGNAVGLQPFNPVPSKGEDKEEVPSPGENPLPANVIPEPPAPTSKEVGITDSDAPEETPRTSPTPVTDAAISGPLLPAAPTDNDRRTDLPTGDPIPAVLEVDTDSPGVGPQTPPETTPPHTTDHPDDRIETPTPSVAIKATTTTTTVPPAFTSISTTLPRVQPYRPFPAVGPPHAIPGNPLLLSFTAPHFFPVAAVVSALVEQ